MTKICYFAEKEKIYGCASLLNYLGKNFTNLYET